MISFLATIATAAPISPSDRDAAVAAITAALEASYVFPEKTAAIVDRIAQSRSSGRYDTGDTGTFAERLTEDLAAASSDGHLYLSDDPAHYAALKEGDGTGADAWDRRRAIRDHHGLTETRILPGNVRYLKVSAFEWIADETGSAYDDALRFLRDGDAVIVDVRGNPGGSHPAVRYLVSHFLAPETLEIEFLEGTNAPVQSWTVDHLPAGRLLGRPLYVLIDGSTGSAAEAFAYDVGQFGLGELVGARTSGAANNNRLVPIAPGFVLSVSYGRPVHPVSGTNWEQVGVPPTIEAPPGQALEVALKHALDRLAGSPEATPETLAEYAWARVAVDAMLERPTVPSGRLKGWTGRYGEIDVGLREGSLWMTRPNRPDRRLVPLTADGWFAVDGTDLLRVRFGPKVLETWWMTDPVPRVFAKGAR